MIMKKEVVINVARWAMVVLCIFACMVLLFAEPNKEVAEIGFWKWAFQFAMTKVGAVICGIVALVLSDIFNKVKKMSEDDCDRIAKQ